MSYEERQMIEAEASKIEAEAGKIEALAQYADAESRRLTASMEAREVVVIAHNEDMLKRDHEYRLARLPHTTKRVLIVTGGILIGWITTLLVTCN